MTKEEIKKLEKAEAELQFNQFSARQAQLYNEIENAILAHDSQQVKILKFRLKLLQEQMIPIRKARKFQN